VAHVEKRTRGGRVSYRARYRAPDGTERNKTFRRKVDAEKFLATVESAKLRGAWTDPAAGRTTLAAWLEEWWGSAADLRPSTVARDEAYFNSLILPRFGGVSLAAIRQPDVQAWVAELSARGFKPATVGQGLPAPRPEDDGGGQRRHGAPLAVPGGAAAQGRAGGDAVPEPGRGRPPGRRDRLALPGAGPGRCLQRAAHRRAGRAASAPGRSAAGHGRCGRDRGRGPGRAVHGAA
jgi:Phage integrase, N-terminal SAM-like domain